jgi:integrase
MKMKAVHIVPLSTQAVSVLNELEPLTGKGRYVFPGARFAERPMSENTVNAALRRLGYGTEELTGHGFRSMASTILNEQGWHRDAIERQLAHAERDSVRAAYNYAEHLPERRRMMQAWRIISTPLLLMTDHPSGRGLRRCERKQKHCGHRRLHCRKRAQHKRAHNK